MRPLERVLFLLSLCALFLSGCAMLPISVMYKTESTAFIAVLGIDWEEGQYIVTVADLEDAGEGEFVSSNRFSSRASALSAAFDGLKVSAEMTPFFGHASYILLGEGVRRENISPVFEYFLSHPEFKLSSIVFLARSGPAADFLETGEEKTPLSSTLDTLSANLEKENSFLLPSIANILQSTYNPRRATLIPVVEKTDDKVRVAGAGYFLNGEFKDEIPFFDYRVMTFLSGRAKNLTLDLSAYSPGASAKALSSRPEITPREENGAVIIEVNFKIEAEIHRGAGKDEAREMIRRYFEDETKSSIDYQIRTGADFIGLLDVLYKYHPEYYPIVAEHPLDVIYETKFKVDVSEVKHNV